MKPKINEDVLNNIYLDIRLMEGENLRTKKYSDSQMVTKIIKCIRKNVDEYDKNNSEDAE